jgi:hypothetical protein
MVSLWLCDEDNTYTHTLTLTDTHEFFEVGIGVSE